MLIFEEEMAKIGISADEKLIKQSEETDMAILQSGLSDNYKKELLDFEKDFRQWVRKDKKRERQNLLDIKD